MCNAVENIHHSTHVPNRIHQTDSLWIVAIQAAAAAVRKTFQQKNGVIPVLYLFTEDFI